MKKFLSILFIIITFALGWWANSLYQSGAATTTPISPAMLKPLEKYTIENLTRVEVLKGKISKKEILEKTPNFTSYIFSFEFDPRLQGKETKKITGQLNIPEEEGLFPLVIMLRGYVDQEIYKTGDGTRKAAVVFAENGYITVAPDFLGYAGSDKEAENILESRFQTYTTVLSLIESLDQIDKWDKKNIFIWGHSNGGQIALVILEITEENYPTTLWAPVSKPFPYSILYFTDEAEDRGKLIRSELAKFEKLYDVELYSLDNYFDQINAPLQIHQGTGDDAVPVSWSNELVNRLKELKIDATYYQYSGANHNLVPSWDTVIARDLAFFEKHRSD